MVEEILKDLKTLSLKGPIKSVRDGSNNSIGLTFRNALNIEGVLNEYKGYRVNASALKNNSRNTLVPGCVPDWKRSLVNNPKEILDLCGIVDDTGKYQKKLFCSVNALEPNTFGLYLKVKRNNELAEYLVKENNHKQIAVWDSERLTNYLNKKQKVVIVSAIKQKKEDGIYFHFCLAEFYIGLVFEDFLKYISYGSIDMDHSISLKKGSKTAQEKGPSFKISKDACSHLYKTYKKYELID